jgi:hypothetical protein
MSTQDNQLGHFHPVSPLPPSPLGNYLSAEPLIPPENLKPPARLAIIFFFRSSMVEESFCNYRRGQTKIIILASHLHPLVQISIEILPNSTLSFLVIIVHHNLLAVQVLSHDGGLKIMSILIKCFLILIQGHY